MHYIYIYPFFTHLKNIEKKVEMALIMHQTIFLFIRLHYEIFVLECHSPLFYDGYNYEGDK